MKTNEILAKLGKPITVFDAGQWAEQWEYPVTPFPADDGMRDAYVISASVFITNGCFANVGYAYAPRQHERSLSAREKIIVTNATVDGGQQYSGQQTPPLRLFTVSSNTIPGGRMIDTDRLPNLGYIPAAPFLEVPVVDQVRLVERLVAEEGGRTHTNWEFTISLPAAYWALLEATTTSNVFNQLLVTVGNEPVFAGRINEPFQNGNFEKTFNEASQVEGVKRELARLQRRK